jgi:hypothetical protein
VKPIRAIADAGDDSDTPTMIEHDVVEITSKHVPDGRFRATCGSLYVISADEQRARDLLLYLFGRRQQDDRRYTRRPPR